MLLIPNAHVVAILNILERQTLAIQPVNEAILGHVEYQVLAWFLTKTQVQKAVGKPHAFHISINSSGFANGHERSLHE